MTYLITSDQITRIGAMLFEFVCALPRKRSQSTYKQTKIPYRRATTASHLVSATITVPWISWLNMLCRILTGMTSDVIRGFVYPHAPPSPTDQDSQDSSNSKIRNLDRFPASTPFNYKMRVLHPEHCFFALFSICEYRH